MLWEVCPSPCLKMVRCTCKLIPSRAKKVQLRVEIYTNLPCKQRQTHTKMYCNEYSNQNLQLLCSSLAPARAKEEWTGPGASGTNKKWFPVSKMLLLWSALSDFISEVDITDHMTDFCHIMFGWLFCCALASSFSSRLCLRKLNKPSQT